MLSTAVLCLCFCHSNDKRIIGKLQDMFTGEPVRGAKITVVGSGDTSISSGEGVYVLYVKPENITDDLVAISVRSADYHDSLFMSRIREWQKRKTHPSMRLIPFGVKGAKLDSLLQVARERNRPLFNQPANTLCAWQPRRTTKPSGLPHCIVRETDYRGGEWFLFVPLSSLFGSDVIYISYRNPDGTYEFSCPVGFSERTNLKFRIRGDTAYIDMQYPSKDSTKVYSSFTLDDIRADADNDGICDRYETYYGLNPHDRDTDGDGIDDLSDVLPLVPYHPITNDTAQVMALAYHDYYLRDNSYSHWLFSNYWISTIADSLPPKPQKWLMKFLERTPKYPYGRAPGNKLDSLLLTFSVAELKYIYPYLKKLQTRPGHTTIFDFPYLDALAHVNEANLDSVRRGINELYYIYYVMPTYLDSPAYELGVHLPDKDAMFFKFPGDDKVNEKEHMSYRYFDFKVIKMNDKFADIGGHFNWALYYCDQGQWLFLRTTLWAIP